MLHTEDLNLKTHKITGDIIENESGVISIYTFDPTSN